MNYMDYTDDVAMFMFTAGPGRPDAGWRWTDRAPASASTGPCDGPKPVKEFVKDLPKDHIKDFVKEPIKDIIKEFAKDPTKDRPKDFLEGADQGGPKDRPKDLFKEPPRRSPRTGRRTPKEPVPRTRSTSSTTPKELRPDPDPRARSSRSRDPRSPARSRPRPVRPPGGQPARCRSCSAAARTRARAADRRPGYAAHQAGYGYAAAGQRLLRTRCWRSCSSSARCWPATPRRRLRGRSTRPARSAGSSSPRRTRRSSPLLG